MTLIFNLEPDIYGQDVPTYPNLVKMSNISNVE